MSSQNTQNQKDYPFPSELDCWRADEVAECIDGISEETYKELWVCVSEAEQSRTDEEMQLYREREEPVITNTDDTSLCVIWSKLTHAAQENLIEASKAHYKKFHSDS